MQLIKDNYTADDILAIVEELPARIFGDREFYTFNHAVTAYVNKDYPEYMTVVTIVDHEKNTIDLLYNDTRDYGFKEPIFIG